MFVPALKSTGLPLIHSMTVRGGAGSPSLSAKLETGAKQAIRPTSKTACLLIIVYEFFSEPDVSKSKISWTFPSFYQQPKTRCRFGVARTGVRRHQGHQTPNIESNPTAAVNVRFDCRLKFRVGVVGGVVQLAAQKSRFLSPSAKK